ncbi:hypothetical protein BDF14DRAFT_1757851 [Spinellus fusiger]|nr:hypothetical protein BDF14DRAFT_1757851 [Spinellus fusiger]
MPHSRESRLPFIFIFDSIQMCVLCVFCSFLAAASLQHYCFHAWMACTMSPFYIFISEFNSRK